MPEEQGLFSGCSAAGPGIIPFILSTSRYGRTIPLDCDTPPHIHTRCGEAGGVACLFLEQTGITNEDDAKFLMIHPGKRAP